MMKTPQRELYDYISEISERADVRTGSPLPLKTQERGGGVDFAIFSRDASRVRLELFDHPEDTVPARVINLDSAHNWADPKCKRLACLIHENGQDGLSLMFNVGTEETDFGLPPLPLGYRWPLAVDTSRLAPQDLSAAGEETLLDNSTTYHVEVRSSVILLARKQESSLGGGSV
jgi:pullulanase/glycogen debranching enzyme